MNSNDARLALIPTFPDGVHLHDKLRELGLHLMEFETRLAGKEVPQINLRCVYYGSASQREFGEILEPGAIEALFDGATVHLQIDSAVPANRERYVRPMMIDAAALDRWADEIHARAQVDPNLFRELIELKDQVIASRPKDGESDG